MNNQTGPARRIARLAAQVAICLAAAGAWADTDGDGIDDAVDNCVLVANPGQQDSDLDGYGNRCDADFNNDFVVNSIDLGELKQAFFSSEAEKDLNGDGLVNAVDLGIFKSYMFSPPGPGAPDTDGDGVGLHQDRCPLSPAGTSVLEDGCTSFDVMLDAERFIDLGAGREPLIAALENFSFLSSVRDGVVAGLAEIDESIARLRRADPCNASEEYWSGYAMLSNARASLAGFAAEYEYVVLGSQPFSDDDCAVGGHPDCEFGADHTEHGLDLILIQDALADLDQLMQRAEDRGGLVSSACTQSTGDLWRLGRVTRVDAENRRVHFTDDGGPHGDYTVGVADNVSILSDVYVGRTIRTIGIEYGADAGVANVFVPVSPEQPAVGLTYDSCALLRIAPFQRVAPVSYGPHELHEPDAYLYENGKLRVEKGMGFATVLNFLGCIDTNDDYTVHYSQDLRLEFSNRFTGLTETRLLAMGMIPNGQPVMIPDAVEHGTDATLTVVFKRQTCPVITGQFLGQTCSEQDVYRTDVYTLSVWDRETFCNVIYDETEFALEYTGPTEFRSTHIYDWQSLLVVPDPGTQMSVIAEGYAVNGNSSSYPSVQTITEGQPFALYSHDCVTQPGQLYVTGTCGTNEASGLRWPRLTGQRNGKTFSYSCSLPQVVRDLRDYCPQAPNALYKLPFRGSGPTWQMSQGNNGDFTHNGNQNFAFDFVANEGTIIRAARRGTVAFVREDQTGNSFFNENCTNCMANRVTIRHEDGSLTDYLHLRTNGALVAQGQQVARGTAIGEVGNTGFSTGPHLHFQARRSGLPTHPVRFEALDNSLSTPPSSCWIPENGDPLASDN